jgi:hypothetical protein
MLLPVAFVLHFTVPLQPVAVKVAVSVPQILVLLVLITGADGAVPVVIFITLLAPLTPQLLLHVAV